MHNIHYNIKKKTKTILGLFNYTSPFNKPYTLFISTLKNLSHKDFLELILSTKNKKQKNKNQVKPTYPNFKISFSLLIVVWNRGKL